MAEHDYVIANQNGANTRSDLNNALAAIVSNNSKATAPTTTYAFMWWADTANDILKQRNAADSAWISILTLSTGAPLAALAASLVSGTHTNFTSTGIDDNATSTAITIDNNGAVTMPSQPAFSVALGANVTNLSVGSWVDLAMSSEIFDQGSDFNTSTYKFTAPVTGKYQLNVGIRFEEVDTATDYVYTAIETSNRAYRFIFEPDFSSDPTYWSTARSVLADMDAGDVAYVRVMQNGGASQMDIANSQTKFSGYLVA